MTHGFNQHQHEFQEGERVLVKGYFELDNPDQVIRGGLVVSIHEDMLDQGFTSGWTCVAVDGWSCGHNGSTRILKKYPMFSNRCYWFVSSGIELEHTYDSTWV